MSVLTKLCKFFMILKLLLTACKLFFTEYLQNHVFIQIRYSLEDVAAVSPRDSTKWSLLCFSSLLNSSNIWCLYHNLIVHPLQNRWKFRYCDSLHFFQSERHRIDTIIWHIYIVSIWSTLNMCSPQTSWNVHPCLYRLTNIRNKSTRTRSHITVRVTKMQGLLVESCEIFMCFLGTSLWNLSFFWES